MKKILVTICMICNLASAGYTQDEILDPEVRESFKSRFPAAENVKWSAGSNYFIASFTCENKVLFAYYNINNRFLGLTRYISSTELPAYLREYLKKKYPAYWIADLFEVINEEAGNNYYVTLETGGNKLLLESKNGGYWEPYQKTNYN